MEEVHKFPGFIDLLKESWEVYAQNFKLFFKLILLSLAFLLVFVLVGAVALAVFSFTGFSLILIVIGVISVLAIIATQLWFQIAIMLAVKTLLDGKTVSSIKNLLELAKPLILPYLGLSLVSMFLVVGGYMLFLIPGFILSIWFWFGMFVLIDENKRGMNALLVSRDYIKGFIVKVFTRWFLFGILTAVVSSLPSLLLKDTSYEGLSSIYSTVISFIITPLSLIYGYLLYKSLKAQKPDLKPDLSKNRKLKYVTVAALGYLLVIGVIIYLASNFGGR
ncbi:hypothetical protein A2803_05840 [Candidatus Woesebacteria bacterium RIFCSPHIGHO2_01_FULL_44_21]|uniref:Glycerophosphoryl diester phosphodiesterase membrane domain-containing protein n=1 Tax=Candidatus Woesebacteria bacterium RIFCSPHIGHO2_01_FULL_44_21 TaxID=1802503 RepID=A0A1F7Z270_9BACT|nr:MAG: hypothetical protein A2803_05840 [Candidatus Woesebacteria bacterium RIFCSPHIGHO2_01_FULL_44_21]OGM71090.1 MAG: hypothetical protein A2897_02585 [Candidatus Woesebacteria bacterium RIFCSPLOWO2_01_FULL_44_24b]